ncbi:MULTISPECIES: TRAP transporter permease [Bilophila]|uniref:TRAP transporter permease n=1 Tax=Bilophila TaxID=35832 RepID=UPI00258045BA|nr:TRAP transporter permease [Bilophila sp.]MBS5454773.1 TRAP transporter permease [Bilophila sp.]
MNMSDDVVREAEKIGEEGYSARTLTGFTYRLFLCIGLVMALFHIYFLGYSSLEPWILYYTHLGFGLALAYLLYPFSAKSNASRPGAADIGLIVLSVAACAYFIISMNEIVFRIGVSPTPLDLVFSSLVILLVLEMTRRTNGFVLPLIAVLFILYGLYGNLLPYSFGGHRGYSFSRLISYLVGMDAMLSTPLATAASFVFLFFLFSSFLASTGAGQFFIDLALGLAGGTRGGPAKVAVIGSALFGMISGSSSANVVASGTFTIPMMIKTGYSPRFSAAVESVASTGGQMTPPILGAAAFIIAELTGTPYLDIALATVIPALLYFTSIYYMIDLEALKLSLMGHKAEDLPNVRSLIVRRGHLLIPILVLLYVMIVMKASVVKAAIFGIYATVLCTFLRRDTRITVNKAVAGIADGAKQAVGLISACATAGLIIGVLNMTGTGLKFAGAVIAFSGGSIPVALFLTMCASLVLGMGLPTAAAYLICAAVVAPALTGLGVPVLTANLFIFYFACLSAITPPVALAAFTASFLARSNPMSVAFTAVRLGFVAFIVPYMFVYAPSLLFQGSPLTIATTIVTALAGVIFIGSALQGYFLGARLPAVSRALFFAAAITLIIPGYLTDGIGAGLGLFGYAVQRCMAKRDPQTQTC